MIKLPIIMPRRNHITELLICQSHEEVGYIGRITTLCQLRENGCLVSIEFSFYLNLNFIPKIEATYSIARIIKSGCYLIARKRLASTKIL